MRRSVPSSPWLTIALAIALAVSLAFHVVGGAPRGRGRAAGPRLRGERARAAAHPARGLRRGDDDRGGRGRAPGRGPRRARPADRGRGGLRHAVPPPDPTGRRACRPSPPSGSASVTAFADARGRAVDLEAGPRLTFPSSVFGLDEPPAPHVGAAGDDVLCSLAFNGPVRRAELEQHLRLESAAGEAIPFTVEGGGVRLDPASRADRGGGGRARDRRRPLARPRRRRRSAGPTVRPDLADHAPGHRRPDPRPGPGATDRAALLPPPRRPGRGVVRGGRSRPLPTSPSRSAARA